MKVKCVLDSEAFAFYNKNKDIPIFKVQGLYKFSHNFNISNKLKTETNVEIVKKPHEKSSK